MRKLCLLITVLLLCAVAAFAQETRGTISGRVLDPQAAAIAGATVAVTNTDTNTTFRLTTNETGYYEANLLLAGNYRTSRTCVAAIACASARTSANRSTLGAGAATRRERLGFDNSFTRHNDDSFTPAGSLGLSWAAFTMGIPSSMTTAGARTLAQWFNTANFERAAAKGPVDYNARVFPTMIGGLRADMTNQWNANVMRQFRFTERLRFDLRLDALNLQNRSQFAGPDTNPYHSTFGQVTSQTATHNRWIQLQGRIRF